MTDHSAVNPVASGLHTTGHHDLSPPPAGAILHGVTVRPPALHFDGIDWRSAQLHHIDTTAALQVPGVTHVVVRGNFIGIIASQLTQARHASAQLTVQWQTPAAPQDTAMNGKALIADKPGANAVAQTYQWSPSACSPAAWAIARHESSGLTIWADTRYPDRLRTEIAALCALPPDAIRLLPTGATGAEAYDAAVDAALLAAECKRAVKVVDDATLSIPPIGVTLQADSTPASTRSTSAPITETLTTAVTVRPSIAALLCGATHTYPQTCTLPEHLYGQAIQTTVVTTPETSGHTRVPINAPVTAAQVFARESFFDEQCQAQQLDPVQARLASLTDPEGRSLIESVARQAGWNDTRQPGTGRGFASTLVVDNTQDPPQRLWAAWVAEVTLDKNGQLDLARVTVGHSATTLPPSGPADHIESTIRQTALGYLKAPEHFDTWGQPTTQQPANTVMVAPDVSVVAQNGALTAGLSWHPNAGLPAAAAIANAIYDASGVRLREAPFNLTALELTGQSANSRQSDRRWAKGLLGGIAAGAAGLIVAALPWRSALPPIPTIDTSIYSAAAIERGRLVALAGDCMVCHTADDGTPNAGGRPLETPFGTVYSTNITPDRKTGIGSWSYAAFERAMREGIHQDGRHLYPVFPYTAFAKLSDADLQSLYAWLMTQDPVSYKPPETRLAFPYSARPLMAGWNALFHTNEVYQPDPTQTTLWNRGAYLVQGAGHCAACHSPRNSLGAEKSGAENFLAGGFTDGWEAPALNALSKAPIAWTEDTLFDYLRTGFSSLHGVASGPMGPVVENLAQLPESDVRAMAHYLASLNPAPPPTEPTALTAARLEDASRSNAHVMTLPAERLFEGACAVCHDAREGPPLFGARPSLALNTNLHSDHPDNIIQAILHGINDPTGQGLGHMPGFKDSLNNQQIRDLVDYMRLRFAPGKPAWNGLDEKVTALRNFPLEP
ncbi:MAG: c-type cytochrome [Pusillimonas sp.]